MEVLYNIILLYNISININKDHKNGARVGTVNRDRMKSRHKTQFGLKLTCSCGQKSNERNSIWKKKRSL